MSLDYALDSCAGVEFLGDGHEEVKQEANNKLIQRRGLQLSESCFVVAAVVVVDRAISGCLLICILPAVEWHITIQYNINTHPAL